MQLLPEVFHKFPDSIPHIGHQGITGILHVNWKLYPRDPGRWLYTVVVAKRNAVHHPNLRRAHPVRVCSPAHTESVPRPGSTLCFLVDAERGFFFMSVSHPVSHTPVCHPEAAESSAKPRTPNGGPMHGADPFARGRELHRSFGPQRTWASG